MTLYRVLKQLAGFVTLAYLVALAWAIIHPFTVVPLGGDPYERLGAMGAVLVLVATVTGIWVVAVAVLAVLAWSVKPEPRPDAPVSDPRTPHETEARLEPRLAR